MRQHFVDSLWMDTPAIQLAVNKVDTMKKNIGYPDWYDEEGRIDEYYDTVETFFYFIVNHSGYGRMFIISPPVYWCITTW